MGSCLTLQFMFASAKYAREREVTTCNMDYFQGDVSNQRKFFLKIAIPLLVITSLGLSLWRTNYLPAIMTCCDYLLRRITLHSLQKRKRVSVTKPGNVLFECRCLSRLAQLTSSRLVEVLINSINASETKRSLCATQKNNDRLNNFVQACVHKCTSTNVRSYKLKAWWRTFHGTNQPLSPLQHVATLSSWVSPTPFGKTFF